MTLDPDLTIAGAPVYLGTEEASLVKLIHDLPGLSSVHLICDANTVSACLPEVPLIRAMSKEPIVIPVGEIFKELQTCVYVWDQLLSQGADRKSLVINLGGGVVTDLGGFCADSFMRGIRFMHIPTTLLGMCDAALGGKHGVDFRGLKNMIGSIVQPQMIWIRPEFLRTLDLRQLRNGMAEVIKHAIIGDPDLFEYLADVAREGHFEDLREGLYEDKVPDVWLRILRMGIAVKKRFVDADPLEQGIRAALNFGHSAGHAIESISLGDEHPLLHGEAVALGMTIEIWLSHFLPDGPDRDTCRRIISLINAYLPVEVPGPIGLENLISFMAQDKKRQSGQIRFALIRRVGQPLVGCLVPRSSVARLMDDPEIRVSCAWLS